MRRGSQVLYKQTASPELGAMAATVSDVKAEGALVDLFIYVPGGSYQLANDVPFFQSEAAADQSGEERVAFP